MFFSLTGLFRPNTRGLTAGSMVSVEHKSQIFFRDNRKFGAGFGGFITRILFRKLGWFPDPKTGV